jgi:hypothetical protein
MPDGAGGRHAEEGPKGTALLGRDLGGRPRDTRDMFVDEAVCQGDVARSKLLVA